MLKRILLASAMAVLIAFGGMGESRADCPAAPIASPNDLVVSFLATYGTQAAPGAILPSTVKEGMLIYDDTVDKLKVCNGTAWVEVGSGGGSLTLAGLSDVSVSGVASGQVLGFNGTAWVPFNVSMVPVMIPNGTGTLIGNMTSSGGLAAAFDGNTSQTDVQGAYVIYATGLGWVGKEFTTAKAVTSWKAWGSSDYGFHNGNANGSAVWGLQYKDATCTVDTGWTTADSVTITNNTQTIDRANVSAGSHLCWRIKRISGGSSGDSRTGELQLYESSVGGGGADTLAGLSCTTGQVAAWSGTAWACANAGGSLTCPSGFTKVSGATRDLGCIQDTEASGSAWTTATNACFTTYGGRLPTSSEWYIAANNYTLTGETGNWEWLSDAVGETGTYDNHAVIGSTAITDVSWGTDTSSYTYRCFIPAAGGGAAGSGSGVTPIATSAPIATTSTTSATAVDMAGATLTFTSNGLPVLIMANFTSYNSTASATGTFQLVVDGNIESAYTLQYSGPNSVVPTPLMVLKNLAAGSHTVKVRWLTNTGTLTANWNTGTSSLIAHEIGGGGGSGTGGTSAPSGTPYGFTATGSQTLATSVTQLTGFTQVRDDGGDNFNPTTGVYTAPKDGYYMFTGQVNVTTSNSNHVHVRLNAGGISVCESFEIASAGNFYRGCSGVGYMTAGQTATMAVGTLGGASGSSTVFNGAYLGATDTTSGGGTSTTGLLKAGWPDMISCAGTNGTAYFDLGWVNAAGQVTYTLRSDYGDATHTNSPRVDFANATAAGVLTETATWANWATNCSGKTLAQLQAAGQAFYAGGSGSSGSGGSEVSFVATGSTTSAPSAVWTELVAGTQLSDVGGDNFNPTTGKFTAPSDGTYTFSASVNFQTTSGRAGLTVQTEGAGSGGGRICVALTNTSPNQNVASCTGSFALAAGQVVEVVGYQESGSASALIANTLQFSGFKVVAGGSSSSSGGSGSTTDVSFSVNKGGTAQTVVAAADTALTWNTELFDPTNAFNTTTGRFTPTVAGKYQINLQALCASSNSATHYCGVLIYKNSTVVARSYAPGATNVDAYGDVSAVVELNGSTDYVEAHVVSSVTSISGTAGITTFSGSLLGGGGSGSSSGSGTFSQVAFRAHKNGTDQSGVATTATKLTFSTEDFDIGNSFNTGTGVFQPTVAGVYQVNASVRCNSSTTYCQAVLYKNGAGIVNQYDYWTNPNMTTVSTLVSMNGTTDTLELYGISGGTAGIVSGVPANTFFEAGLLGGVGSSSGSSSGSTTSPGFYAHKNGTAQTVTSSAWAKLTFSTETFDTTSNFDTATGRFTPTVAGKYQFNVSAQCSDATTFCSVMLSKNYDNCTTGAGYIAQGYDDSNGKQATTSSVIEMNGTTDYVVGCVYNSGGTNVAGASYVTNFSGNLFSGGGSGSGSTSTGSTSAGPFFYVTKGGVAQSSVVNGTTVITWPTEVTDTDSMFASNRFTPTIAGRYIITAQVRCTSSSNCITQINKNAATVARSGIVGNGLTSNFGGPATIIVDMNGSTDYIDVTVFNDSTDTVAGAAQDTYFMGSMLGGTAGGSSTGPGSISNPVAFRAHKNGTDQTVVSGANTLLTFSNEFFDTGSAFDTTTGRFTPQTAGKYQINLTAYCSNSTNYCQVFLYKNGIAYAGRFSRTNSTNASSNVSAIVDMNGTTDYITAQAVNNGGTTISGDATATFLEGYLLGGGGGGSGSSGTPGFLDGVTVGSQTTNTLSSACPTFVDVPSSSKSITIPAAGNALVNFSQVFYGPAGGGGVQYRYCLDSTCTTGQYYYSNEGSSHKTAAGNWVVPVTAGTYTAKLQYCVASGAAIYQNSSGSTSWAMSMPGSGGGMSGLSCSVGQVPAWSGTAWTCAANSGGAAAPVPYLRLSYTANALTRSNVIPLTVAESGGGATWASNRFTATQAGLYYVAVNGYGLGTTFLGLTIRKNGAGIFDGFGSAEQAAKNGGTSASGTLYLNVGDYLDFYYNHDSPSITLNTATASIAMITGGASGGTDTSFSGSIAAYTVPTTETTATGYTENFDTGNAFNPTTGLFTAPTAGRYMFTANATSNGTATTNFYGYFRINGVLSSYTSRSQAGVSQAYPISAGSTIYNLNAGDTVGFGLLSATSHAAFVQFQGSKLTGGGGSGGSDTLAGLSCTSGQVPTWSGTAWACGTVGSGGTTEVSFRGTVSAAALTLNTNTTVAGYTQQHNVGSAFVPATGIFTAPVAGRYIFKGTG